MLDLVCMGRSSLDLFGDALGQGFAQQTRFNAYVGGSPNNICVAARRLGLRTGMLTAVGADYAGDFIVEFLRREGVDVSGVKLKPGYITNTVAVALLPPDQMEFVAYHALNADLQLTMGDVLDSPLASSRVALISGMGLLADPARTATLFAAELAREQGARIIMDVDYRAPMWEHPRSFGVVARSALRLVDIAIGTDEELIAAAGQHDLASAVERLLGLVSIAVVVKRGADGSTVYTKTGEVHPAAAFPAQVVNFLGAGDAFAAGFIYQYLNGADWRTCARFGNACGAIIVAEHGTANMMPPLAQVQAFIREHGGL